MIDIFEWLVLVCFGTIFGTVTAGIVIKIYEFIEKRLKNNDENDNSIK